MNNPMPDTRVQYLVPAPSNGKSVLVGYAALPLEPYVLRLTSFERGINLLTGRAQGGHTYATIKDHDWKDVVQVTKVIDADYLATIRELDPTDDTYKVGDETYRLMGDDEAIALAVAWMRENEPARALVEEYGTTVHYQPPTKENR